MISNIIKIENAKITCAFIVIAKVSRSFSKFPLPKSNVKYRYVALSRAFLKKDRKTTTLPTTATKKHTQEDTLTNN